MHRTATGYLWPLYLSAFCAAVVSYAIGKWLHNRAPVDAIIIVVLLLVWISGLAFVRIVDPNTITWVGVGLAAASLILMLATGLYARIVRKRRMQEEIPIS
jgi:di/tricarboxylate transporter